MVPRRCPVVIGEREFGCYFLTMKLPSVDVIFGMDWLSLVKATINCHSREVSFQLPGEDPYIFKAKCSPELKAITNIQEIERTIPAIVDVTRR